MGLDPPDKVVKATRRSPQASATDAKIQRLLDAAILAADTIRSQARDAAQGEAEQIRTQAHQAAEAEAEQIRNNALASARIDAQRQADAEVQEALVAARVEADVARSRIQSVLTTASSTISSLRELLGDLILTMTQVRDFLAEPGQALDDQLTERFRADSEVPGGRKAQGGGPDAVGDGDVAQLLLASPDASTQVDEASEATTGAKPHSEQDPEVASEPAPVDQAAIECVSGQSDVADRAGGEPLVDDVDHARDGHPHPHRPLGSLFRIPKT